MALPRGFQIYLPFGEVGTAFFEIQGGAKYNPESFRDGETCSRQAGSVSRIFLLLSLHIV